MALSREIEEKRRLLGAEHGLVAERDLVRHVVGERIGEAVGAAATAAGSATDPVGASQGPTTPPPSSSPGPSAAYLATLDDETVAKINSLLGELFALGVQKTIKKVVEEDPFILDAFHDALVDKLYDELKKHGVVNSS